MTENLASQMAHMGAAARSAAQLLALATTRQKNQALRAAAAAVRSQSSRILAANALDVAEAQSKGFSAALIDRLRLDANRLESMARGLQDIEELSDPVNVLHKEWTRPNGLRIQRISVPLGVMGMIYESRPNVTADAGGLCLKSGNAVILRGGSESARSNAAIHACLEQGLREAGLPIAAIQIVPTSDRAAVGHMLADMREYIDVIVPRGGKDLVARVQREARVPVIGHLEGVCHVYVHRGADLDMALRIVLNAKLRRTGVCGAAETLLIDAQIASTHLLPLVQALLDAGCEVRGDAASQAADPRVRAAVAADWSAEYLEAIIAVKLVQDFEEAISHIASYGSKHTDCIVTDDGVAAARFLSRVDSAIVLHNASTQFADGGEFGMGAEIGISTAKFHARGPVGVEQLVSYKYLVQGSGQIRP